MIYCTLTFFCYISDKQCKNNKYWFSWQNLKVDFFQLGMTFHGMGLYREEMLLWDKHGVTSTKHCKN